MISLKAIIIFIGLSNSSPKDRSRQMVTLTPDILLAAYARGIFPMSDDRDDPDLYWVDPQRRGIFPLEHFHISKSLQKAVRQQLYQVTVDKDFSAVIHACAAVAPDRRSTWINDTIIDLFEQLHAIGHAHSIECWQGDELVGGLYGVSFASVFCGESMFSIKANASKIALVYLIARLKAGGFTLLDTQFVTDHLESLGAIEISRRDYHKRLEAGLETTGNFQLLSPSLTGPEILQSITQTS